MKVQLQLHCAAEFKKKISHCIVVAVVSSQVCFISDKWLFFGRLIFRDCVWNCAQSSCHFPYLFIVFLLQSVAADLSYLQHLTATGCTFSPPLHLLILIQLPSQFLPFSACPSVSIHSQLRFLLPVNSYVPTVSWCGISAAGSDAGKQCSLALFLRRKVVGNF